MMNEKKTYPETEDQFSTVGEPAAYAGPVRGDAQQATMQAIMLMFSTLDDRCKRAISNQINLTPVISDEEADRILAEKLCARPSWDEVEHTSSMDTLSKEDYIQVIKSNRRKPMKGIEKWL